MEYFVNKDSIVRQIWGKGDTILFIFAGASAEFALNKAVDWLYFTGRLPADPLGRLFSTVAYARLIVFSEKEAANRAIDKMAAIHSRLEEKRGVLIPDWAYRDVLFMLIDYSIRSYELLERKLSDEEKNEVFQVFNRVGTRMGIQGLPETFRDWTRMRREHLEANMQKSNHTIDLYKKYHKHLGPVRYKLLLEAQKLVSPEIVLRLLGFNHVQLLTPVLKGYKLSRIFKLDWLLKAIILPKQYREEIKGLDVVPQ
ncbi:oxygenase MpaB family protein [Adhaeribacter soli]|uniref:DUF2236 domain-containing protein n=1 Tax=Adhaeribacter soli TaxID=2607655 RepID=A0A5N1J4C2_9BACT|nr:oxygenase MpaB family protein [Adhaeribacter soli]KAA9345534.1 DUF2236 domain-containing protein [Adhaeribacter soli]